MVDALEALIAQPSLRSFTISNAWDITTSFILRAVASVTFFSINGFNVVVDEASLVPVPEFPGDFHASLKHLVVRYETRFPGGPRLADVLLSAPASLVHLERLHVNIQEPQRLLLAVATTLQHLRIDDATSYAPPAFRMALSPTPRGAMRGAGSFRGPTPLRGVGRDDTRTAGAHQLAPSHGI
ncbi:hypothetical protein C8J57DRAFT_1362599, partial [Mycena rebaudengoi]